MSEPTEHEIQRQVLELLKRKRVMHWRHNVGKGKGWVRFGQPGQPDIFAIRHGRITAIEVKGHKGEQSRAQMEFQSEIEKAGGEYLLVRSAMEVERWLAK